jgi:hypothetical protein
MALDVRCQCSGSVAVTWAVGCGDECPKSQIVIEFGIARAFRRTDYGSRRYICDLVSLTVRSTL